MNILFDGRPLLRPWYGGVPRLASRLLDAMKEPLRDHRILVASTGFDQPTNEITVHKKIPNKLVAALTWSGLSSFDRLFADLKPDILFLPNIEFVGRPAIPYALLVHDLSFLIEPRWFHRKSRIWHRLVHAPRLMREASHLFAVSEHTKNDLMRMLDIDAARITVIPMGLDRMEPAPAKNEGRFVLCVGGGNARKNVECVQAAHAALVQDPRFADVRLEIVGYPDRPHPSDAELFALMRDAAVFCYPSWYEGFGLPLHEAARFGTPCIASTAGSLPEIAPAGTRFADPAKPRHWKQALESALLKQEGNRTHTDIGNWAKAGEIVAKRLTSGLK
jgi:glycosyltransferase involved in cell wall biosynthesis